MQSHQTRPSLAEDPLYQGMSSQDLQQALQSLQLFRESKGFELFLRDYELAEKAATRAVCGLTPESIKDFTNREQLIGGLSQLAIAQEWFDEKTKELTTLLRNVEEQHT